MFLVESSLFSTHLYNNLWNIKIHDDVKIEISFMKGVHKLFWQPSYNLEWLQSKK